MNRTQSWLVGVAMSGRRSASLAAGLLWLRPHAARWPWPTSSARRSGRSMRRRRGSQAGIAGHDRAADHRRRADPSRRPAATCIAAGDCRPAVAARSPRPRLRPASSRQSRRTASAAAVWLTLPRRASSCSTPTDVFTLERVVAAVHRRRRRLDPVRSDGRRPCAPAIGRPASGRHRCRRDSSR